MNITVIETPTSKYGKFAVIYGMAAWPRGTLKNRGWLDARVVYQRAATDDEVTEQKSSARFLAFRYPEWNEVVVDEAKYGIDADALKNSYYDKLIAELSAAADQAPQTEMEKQHGP